MSNDVDMHFHDAMRDTRFAYWNALLTLNGIVATIFAASTFFSDNLKFFSLVIVAISISACWLIIANYKTSKLIYQKLTEPMNNEQLSQLSNIELENMRDAGIKEAIRLNKKIDRNEKANDFLFLLQLFLILILSGINVI